MLCVMLAYTIIACIFFQKQVKKIFMKMFIVNIESIAIVACSELSLFTNRGIKKLSH